MSAERQLPLVGAALWVSRKTKALTALNCHSALTHLLHTFSQDKHPLGTGFQPFPRTSSHNFDSVLDEERVKSLPRPRPRTRHGGGGCGARAAGLHLCGRYFDSGSASNQSQVNLFLFCSVRDSWSVNK